jgi:hypothetical protein
LFGLSKFVFESLCKYTTYYYQIKGKSLNDNTNAMIKFIKQTAIEVGPAYGKRRMRVSLNNQGYNIGIRF